MYPSVVLLYSRIKIPIKTPFELYCNVFISRYKSQCPTGSGNHVKGSYKLDKTDRNYLTVFHSLVIQ